MATRKGFLKQLGLLFIAPKIIGEAVKQESQSNMFNEFKKDMPHTAKFIEEDMIDYEKHEECFHDESLVRGRRRINLKDLIATTTPTGNFKFYKSTE